MKKYFLPENWKIFGKTITLKLHGCNTPYMPYVARVNATAISLFRQGKLLCDSQCEPQ